MAKRAKKKYLVLVSECGDVSQLESFGSVAFATEQAAKNAVTDWLTHDNGDGETWVIAEILEVGRTNAIAWKQDVELG